MATENTKREPYESEVGRWFDGQIKNATIQVERVPLSEVSGWGPYLDEDGKVYAWGTVDSAGNPTNKNMVVDGFRVSKALREVGAWDQTGFTEIVDPSDPDGACGTVGLLVSKETGKLLLVAVAEPFAADPGSEPEYFVNLRASLQGSYTNISDHKVQNSHLVNLRDFTFFNRFNPSRILGKVRYGVSIVNESEVDLNAYQKQASGEIVSIGENARWFSREEIDQAILEGVPMNGALSTALNLYKALSDQGKLS